MVGVAYPPLPCRASPPQGGRLARRTCVAPSRPKKNAGSCRESISPLEGEMPGRAEGGIPRANVAIPCPEPATPC
ncbi:hypothetical protein CFBP7129_01685 [Agrobacterium tumefaciens]|uniref:Propionyl-coenzyme A carboxylase alpha polypeptide n=1 Tax=Agrobacterium tumefaciens TaxID=358 RepID=A0A4D7YV00_AGRTU|nr:hypothetical protein CFBP7129_01685 [Agrobacterium tumefaciens]